LNRIYRSDEYKAKLLFELKKDSYFILYKYLILFFSTNLYIT